MPILPIRTPYTTEKPLDYQGLNESMMKNCYAVFGMYRGLKPQFNCVDNIQHTQYNGDARLNDNTINLENKNYWISHHYSEPVLTETNFTINFVIRGKGVSQSSLPARDLCYFSGTSVGLEIGKQNLADTLQFKLFGTYYSIPVNINTHAKTILTISVRNTKLVIMANSYTVTHTISTTRPLAGSLVNTIIGSGYVPNSWNGYIDLMTFWTGDIDAQALHNAPYSVFRPKTNLISA